MFGITMPVLLPLTALAALPVIIHLLAKRKPPRKPFPDVRFLNEIAKVVQRFEKPRDLILILLRTGALFAFLAAFSLPIYYPRGRILSVTGARDAVIIVDRSMSMQYAPGGLRRFDQALARAKNVVDGLPAGSRVDVVWLDATSTAFTGKLTENLAAVRNELDHGEVTYSKGNPASALRTAVKILEDQGRAREMYVVSDFQTSNWRGVDIDSIVPASVNVILINIDERVGRNTAVVRLDAVPSTALAGESVAISARIANYSPEPGSVSVLVKSEGFRRQEDLYIPAWGEAEALWNVRAAVGGDQVVEVGTARDDLSGDDHRYVTVRVKPSLRVALAGNSEGCRYIENALNALVERGEGDDKTSRISIPVVVEKMSDTEMTEGKVWDLLVVCDKAHFKLLDTAKYDGAVVLVDEEGGPYNIPLPDGRVIAVGTAVGGRKSQDANEGRGFHLSGGEDEILKVFTGGASGDPSLPTIFSYRDMKLPERADTILFYQDTKHTPALARAMLKDGRTVYIWNIALSPEKSNFAGSNTFLPLVAEIAMRCRNPLESRTLIMGASPSCRIPAEADTAAVAVKRPDGMSYSPSLTMEGESLTAALEPMSIPGVYTVLSGDLVIAQFTCNPWPEESDLRDAVPGGGRGTVVVPAGVSLSAAREGIPFWPFLFGAAIVLLGLENLAVTLLRRNRGMGE
jgi:hypothetical protein